MDSYIGCRIGSLYVISNIGNVVRCYCSNCNNYINVSETVKSLNELRDEIKKKDNEIDSKVANKKIDDIHKEWDWNYDTLAYYIEHDELEKVTTQMRIIKADFESDLEEEVIPEIEEGIYILEHIKEKETLNLKNVL